jgi:hypothetical protein
MEFSFGFSLRRKIVRVSTLTDLRTTRDSVSLNCAERDYLLLIDQHSGNSCVHLTAILFEESDLGRENAKL